MCLYFFTYKQELLPAACFSRRDRIEPPMRFLDEVHPLTKTNKLSSGYINRAMEILKQQHPEIGGLYCCTMGGSLTFPQANGPQWMQIVHDGSDHWVLVAKGFSQPNYVLVYDSMAGSNWRSKHILSCMSSLLKTPEKEMTYVIKTCQRQGNGFDCGVFAIAFATSLANGQDPALLLYDPHELRNHLDNCITSGELSPFPSTLCRVKRTRKELVVSESVFCHCRRTAYMLPSREWKMIECEQCMEWFHTMCIDNFPVNENDPWSCKVCKS